MLLLGVREEEQYLNPFCSSDKLLVLTQAKSDGIVKIKMSALCDAVLTRTSRCC